MLSLFGFLNNQSPLNPSIIEVAPAQEAEQVSELERLEQEGKRLAELAYETFDHLPNKFRKTVVMRLIAKHNADTELESDKILLREQGDFQAKYPKLNQWIENKLKFFHSQRSLANVAFASGHFADFLDARDNYASDIDKARCGFFRGYFQKKGTTKGINDLSKIISILNKYNVVDGPKLDQFKKAKIGLDVEEIKIDKESSSSKSQFNYLAALSVVDKINPSHAIALAMSIGLGYFEFKKIESENPGLSLSFLVVFHLATTNRNLTDKGLVKAFDKAQLGLLADKLNERQGLLTI